MQSPGDSTQGFALVLVLWVALLLAVIGASLINEARSEREYAASGTSSLRSKLLLEGATNRIILSLIDPTDELRGRIDGSVEPMHLLGEDVTFRVESQSGCIDLNAAPQGLLIKLFNGAGLHSAESQKLVDRIMAWRAPVRAGDPDPAADVYLTSGRRYGPRHNSFRSVGELNLIVGMTDALASTVAPALTVFSGSPNLDYGVANAEVLKSLAAAGDSFAAAQWAARLAGNAAGNDRSPEIGESLRIFVDWQNSAVEREQSTVIRLTGNAQRPYEVLDLR